MSKPVDVDTYDSLFELDSTIRKHLWNTERALLVSFKLAILSIPKDIDMFVNIVVMRSSLGIVPDVIIINTLLFLSPHLIVVGLIL